MGAGWSGGRGRGAGADSVGRRRCISCAGPSRRRRLACCSRTHARTHAHTHEHTHTHTHAFGFHLRRAGYRPTQGWAPAPATHSPLPVGSIRRASVSVCALGGRVRTWDLGDVTRFGGRDETWGTRGCDASRGATRDLRDVTSDGGSGRGRWTSCGRCTWRGGRGGRGGWRWAWRTGSTPTRPAAATRMSIT